MRSKKIHKSTKIRLKMNYLAIIYYSKKIDLFCVYRHNHENISWNRCARSFILKHKIFYDWKKFLIGYSKRDDILKMHADNVIEYVSSFGRN